jgi:hypothetical protein
MSVGTHNVKLHQCVATLRSGHGAEQHSDLADALMELDARLERLCDYVDRAAHAPPGSAMSGSPR